MGIRVETNNRIKSEVATHDISRGASEAFSLSPEARLFVSSRERSGSEVGVIFVNNRGIEQIIVDFYQGKGEPPIRSAYSDLVTVEEGQTAAFAYEKEEIRDATIIVFHTDGEVRLEPLPIGSPEPVAA